MQNRRRALQHWISALLLPCYLGACTSWHRDTQPLPVTLAADPAPKLRVTLTNDQRLTLTDPRQVGDSVVGWMTLTPEQLRQPGLRDRHPRIAIALSDIQTVERARTHAVKTVALVPVLHLLAGKGLPILLYMISRGLSGSS